MSGMDEDKIEIKIDDDETTIAEGKNNFIHAVIVVTQTMVQLVEWFFKLDLKYRIIIDEQGKKIKRLEAKSKKDEVENGEK
jgi:hypothetical protein